MVAVVVSGFNHNYSNIVYVVANPVLLSVVCWTGKDLRNIYSSSTKLQREHENKTERGVGRCAKRGASEIKEPSEYKVDKL